MEPSNNEFMNSLFDPFSGIGSEITTFRMLLRCDDCTGYVGDTTDPRYISNGRHYKISGFG